MHKFSLRFLVRKTFSTQSYSWNVFGLFMPCGVMTGRERKCIYICTFLLMFRVEIQKGLKKYVPKQVGLWTETQGKETDLRLTNKTEHKWHLHITFHIITFKSLSLLHKVSKAITVIFPYDKCPLILYLYFTVLVIIFLSPAPYLVAHFSCFLLSAGEVHAIEYHICISQNFKKKCRKTLQNFDFIKMLRWKKKKQTDLIQVRLVWNHGSVPEWQENGLRSLFACHYFHSIFPLLLMNGNTNSQFRCQFFQF